LTEKTAAMAELCPLCGADGSDFYEQRYFCCENCKGIFLAPSLRLEPELEKIRYEKHNNDVNDPGYQKFVEPVVNAVLANFSAQHRGLDFGAGKGPVVSSMLAAKGCNIALYDPFFHNHTELLLQTYDYIVCCEVIEHFYQPAEEFGRLHSLLKPCGKLICKTLLYDRQTDFSRWFYKNDETHVFFYQAATMAWIEENFGFCDLHISDRLIELTCKKLASD
jgi:endogenous inhibitor of DNA gyrase (YacG/DUF329 family)